MTTYGTLSSAGDSFFTSLFSGRHKNTTDSSGALFIDSKSHVMYTVEPLNIKYCVHYGEVIPFCVAAMSISAVEIVLFSGVLYSERLSEVPLSL